MTASAPAVEPRRSRLVRGLRSPVVLVPVGLVVMLGALLVYASPYLLAQYHVRQMLRRPYLYHAPLGWDEFERLTWWERLQHLHVRLRSPVSKIELTSARLLRTTPDRLSHLAGLPGLKRVSLSGGSFGAADLHQLARIRSLQTLVVCFRAEVDLEAFRELSGHPSLQEIRLDSADAVGERLPLVDLPQLRTLRVQSFPLRDVELAQLPKLSLVSIKRCPFEDVGVAHLRPVAGSLRRLELPATRITAACLGHLLALDHLETLDLRRLQQSERGTGGWTISEYEQLDNHPTLRRVLLRPYSDKSLPPEAAGLQRVLAL